MRNYNDPVYADWRKQVYKRDAISAKCRDVYKKALNAHHTKMGRCSYLRYDINNGITLCWKCHRNNWMR